ncbi:helix-turn-helix transcriptional regulator [Sphingobium subterraneum]|uniref:Prophage regulatory protein n=1 Tax=Sphingobium subterraneum TaxID=627688 RepID=A0A841IVH3_9SPHN|nr:AlpA family phage regulatory protein [Sphingobium subterraneum]MBB6122919.1 prophage regulatory protein [Sphingobium subterraneum]
MTADTGPSVPINKTDCFLRLPAVLNRVGLSRATLYRKIRDGSFPRQVAISANSVGWRETDISRWMTDPGAYQQ